MISSASAAIGTRPLELDIFDIPLMPTNAYIGPIGRSPPKISDTSCPPTTHDDPGEWWSTPAGSNTTPSYTQRIGQSTFHTSLPWWNSDSRTVSACPHEAQVYRSSVVSSSYDVTVVVSRSQEVQYGLYG